MAYGGGMEYLEEALAWLANWAPALGVTAFVVVGLLVMRRVLIGKRTGAEESLPGQLTMFALTVFGLVLIILSLPFGSELRGQVLSLLGLVFTAVIALSSTTFVANAMGGLLLRVVKSFRLGDYIRVKEHFGRVTERGLFHTEIQTEDRDLVTLPNLFVVTNPVRVIRSSGTVVSVSLSLGYDIPRDVIESELKKAAIETGLKDAFVRLEELGDFSVTYKVAGFLEGVESLLTTRSRLRAEVLDGLHGAGIEIVSPTFMNQRVLPVAEKVVPPAFEKPAEDPSEVTVEAMAFDKADQAGSIELLRDELATLDARIAEVADKAEQAELQGQRETLAKQIEAAIKELSAS